VGAFIEMTGEVALHFRRGHQAVDLLRAEGHEHGWSADRDDRRRDARAARSSGEAVHRDYWTSGRERTLRHRSMNGLARNALLTDNADSYDGRVDWVATPRDSIFVRYTNSNRNRFIPGFYGGIGDGTSTSAWGRQVLKGQSAVVGWTHVLSPTLVNEFRVGFTRSFSFAAQDPFGQNQVDEFVPGVPENPAVAGGISQITLTNFTFIGSPDFLPKQQVPQQYQWVDNLSKTTGRHSLKVGLDLRAPMRNVYQDEPGTRGSLTFDKIFTCQRDVVTHQCTGNTGLSYADFLLGEVKASQLTNVHFVDQRLWMLSGFVEDDFKLRRNLPSQLLAQIPPHEVTQSRRHRPVAEFPALVHQARNFLRRQRRMPVR